jgi:hypothetical protein
MNRNRYAVVWVLGVAILSSPCWGQVYQKNYPQNPGQVLDKSPQVGAGGFNGGGAIGSYGSFARDSQLYVTGQTTGMSSFHGPIPYTPSDQFQINLPSASLSGFNRLTVGVQDLGGGSVVGATPYLDRSKTILSTPAIVSGLTMPGTNVPLVPTVDATVRATLNAPMYVDALAEYKSLIPTVPGQALSSPLLQLPKDVYVTAAPESNLPGITYLPTAQVQAELGTGRGMLLGLLADRDRALLGQEFYDLENPNKPMDLSISGRMSLEPNLAPPGDPNNWRSMKNTPVRPGQAATPRGGGGAGAGAGAGTPVKTVDTFLELLQKMQEKREGIPTTPRRLEANAPAAGGLSPGRTVEMSSQGLIVIHSLAGRGDLTNLNLTQAEARLKEGKFYEAAEGYQMAAQMNPANPLPHLGRGIALMEAGEPASAAREIRAAMDVFPPIMEMRLDYAGLTNLAVFQARLGELDARLREPEEERDPLLPFLACYLHFSEGDLQMAKTYAEQVQKLPDQGRWVQAFAEFVLTGKRPTTQPAVMGLTPSTPPAKAAMPAPAPTIPEALPAPK